VLAVTVTTPIAAIARLMMPRWMVELRSLAATGEAPRDRAHGFGNIAQLCRSFTNLLFVSETRRSPVLGTLPAIEYGSCRRDGAW
jgi:hypothetical protein